MASKTNSNKKKSSLAAKECPWRPRKIGCPEEMAILWGEYKAECDNHTIIKSFVEHGMLKNIEVRAPRTYTIKGFCLYLGINESTWQRTYKDEQLFSDVVEMIRMDCEVDSRGKFEDGILNPRLAPLWMSSYEGYSAKTQTEIKGGVPVVISGEDKLED